MEPRPPPYTEQAGGRWRRALRTAVVRPRRVGYGAAVIEGNVALKARKAGVVVWLAVFLITVGYVALPFTVEERAGVGLISCGFVGDDCEYERYVRDDVSCRSAMVEMIGGNGRRACEDAALSRVVSAGVIIAVVTVIGGAALVILRS